MKELLSILFFAGPVVYAAAINLYSLLETVKTAPGARTMALDSAPPAFGRFLGTPPLSRK